MFAVKETIRKRKSTRTFDGRPLSAEDRNKIDQFIANVPNPFGTKVEFRMLDAKGHGLASPVIVGTDLFFAAKAKMDEGYEVGYGYSFEVACLYAESIGVGTVMLAATINREAFEAAMELEEGEGMPVASPIGYAAQERAENDTKMRRGLNADERLPFGALFFDGSFENPLDQEKAGVFGEALEMARWAPSAGNRQPWRAVVEGNTVHFYENATFLPNHFGDTQMVDMGIALAHFDLTMREEGHDGRFDQADPDLDLPEEYEDAIYIASYVLE